MKDHKLKGMGCEFDDLISDTAKVSETTVNGMSETDRKAALDSLENYISSSGNFYVSVLGIVGAKNLTTIRAALQTPRSLSDECIHECRVMIKEKTGLEAAFFDDLIALLIEKANAPRVPVIPGLDEAISKVKHRYVDEGYIEVTNDDILTILKAARAYAALPKMQKVDLDQFLFLGSHDYCNGNNKAIELIKSKYGELYAEVKE